eukprot:3720289-Pleurochrysis_carterae.AAC.1
MSRVKIEKGQQRLHVNMLYALCHETGELHLPKDDARRELALTQAQVSDLRGQIQADAMEAEERAKLCFYS